MTTEAQRWLQEGAAFHKSGRLAEAETMYRRVLAADPRHFDALHLLGVVALQAQNFAQAVTLIGRALEINPSSAAAHNNQGNALRALKQLDAAIASYGAAVALKADYAEAFSNCAIALMEKHDYPAAVVSCDEALRLRPDDADTYNNRGVALREMNRHGEALTSFDAAVRLRPDHAEAHCGRGICLSALHQYDAAFAAYDRAIGLNPAYAEAYFSRGITLSALQRYAAAVGFYDQAIRLKPDFTEAHNHRGIALAAMIRLPEAIASYDNAIRSKPDAADAYNNRGHALMRLRHYEAAIASYDTALDINPAQPFLYGTRLYAKTQVCDWRDMDRETALLSAKIEQGEKAIPPFPVLALVDSPALQRRAAEIWVNDKFPPDNTLGAIPARPRRAKIRVGYFSMDFREHPVSYLTAELFEIHDRATFEVYAFSYGPDTQDEMRQRLEKGFDRFIDVSGQGDRDVAALARTMEIDIAVDLAGLTAEARTGIFAHRAAPIQISYAGYLGTLGAPYMDYILADAIQVPTESRQYFSEKIVYLPHYQVNDTKRAIADRVFTRAELGLPPTGFVFCCFNNTYKITSATFDSWMRILRAVEGSVLFLYAENDSAAVNLRGEAAARGVAANRLIFGERLPRAEYLARYRAADLFLDTSPYNAGTTASDALYAGLPVLTWTGASFASRTAASVLHAIDLPELIAGTRDDYEGRAIALAGDPAAFERIRDKLARHTGVAPLFNTKLFARHLEKAFGQAYERWIAGLPPDHISAAP